MCAQPNGSNQKNNNDTADHRPDLNHKPTSKGITVKKKTKQGKANEMVSL